MTRFAIVGSGWRAEYFWRLGAALEGLTCVGVVSRRPRELPVPVYGSLAECLGAARPAFVVTAVPWAVTPSLVVELTERGVPVLAETPPAPDLDGLRGLWRRVGGSGRVQVAEQYTRMPAHAARIALVRSGAIGDPTRWTSPRPTSTTPCRSSGPCWGWAAGRPRCARSGRPHRWPTR